MSEQFQPIRRGDVQVLRLINEVSAVSQSSVTDTSTKRLCKRERRYRRFYEETPTSVVPPRSQASYSHWASRLSGEAEDSERLVRIYDGTDAEQVRQALLY